MITWKPFHRPKRFLFCYSVSLFLLFGLGLLFPSFSASAVSVGTSGFDLYFRTTSSGSYTWRNSLAYGFSNGLSVGRNYSVMRYQFNTASLVAGGNHASIHFETNIVSTVPNSSYSSDFFVNLPQQYIITCVGAGGFSGTSAVSKNLSYVVTRDWTSSNGSNTTVTYYGDVTLENITPNATGSFTCMIGSDYDFYKFPSNSPAVSGRLWFEQNPISVSWSNNKTDSLLSTTINQNNQIISGISETNSLLESQIASQEQANNQQQEQYEAEKDEESDREDEQSESADQMSGLFNFSILNPFAGIFELFKTGSACVSIPTLSSWLHTEQTQVCPFFPSSVISILTPVLGVSSMMLLFGFFVRWLNGSSGDGTIRNPEPLQKVRF